MRALNFKLIFMFFACALSIDVVWAVESGLKTREWPASPGHSMVTLSGKRRPTRKKRKFKYVDHTCESGCIENYKSSDGHPISLYLACWTSTAEEAQQEMQRMISEGPVIRKVRRYYRRGRERILGTRTVAIYPPETDDKPAKIFWYVEGSCFEFIEAGSLELALEFERSDELRKVEGW